MYCDLTQDYLRSVLDYDPESGVFMWKRKPSNNVDMSRPAGNVQSTGYRVIRVNGTLYKAHRLAWLHFHGFWPPALIDHINGEKSDNRIQNLRCATPLQNVQNQTKPHRGNKSGALGVSVEKSGFSARIRVDGRLMRLGYYGSLTEAQAAYVTAKRRLHQAGTL